MKIFKTLAVFALALTSGVALAETKAINDVCPLKDKAVDGSRAVEVSASFCCGNCLSKFEAEPLKYVAKLAAAEEGKCPLSGRAVDADATTTFKIAVCCGGCERKVKKDATEALEKLGKSS